MIIGYKDTYKHCMMISTGYLTVALAKVSVKRLFYKFMISWC